MRCPTCRLENPPGTLRCDCGLLLSPSTAEVAQAAFVDKSLGHLESIDRSLMIIRRIVLTWAILTVFGFLVWFTSRLF